MFNSGLIPSTELLRRNRQQRWRPQNTSRLGKEINTSSNTGFVAALEAARNSDLVIHLGGIDNSIENEGNDRTSLTWPGSQLDLISQLSNLSKPTIVVQFGDGQLDDSTLLQNKGINALIWARYPSQDGGPALFDILLGKRSIASRLPVTVSSQLY